MFLLSSSKYQARTYLSPLGNRVEADRAGPTARIDDLIGPRNGVRHRLRHVAPYLVLIAQFHYFPRVCFMSISLFVRRFLFIVCRCSPRFQSTRWLYRFFLFRRVINASRDLLQPVTSMPVVSWDFLQSASLSTIQFSRLGFQSTIFFSFLFFFFN